MAATTCQQPPFLVQQARHASESASAVPRALRRLPLPAPLPAEQVQDIAAGIEPRPQLVDLNPQNLQEVGPRALAALQQHRAARPAFVRL